MTVQFVDLETEVDAFLVDKGIAETIYFQKFAEDADNTKTLIMISSDAIGPAIPVDVPIDAHRIKITVRDPHPKDALDKSLEILNLIHGVTPGKFHPTSALSLISALVDERPQRTDNTDQDIPQFIAFYLFRVKPLVN